MKFQAQQQKIFMNNYFTLLWRSRQQLWQDIASITVFLLVLGFINKDLDANIIWLLWSWGLIYSGSKFWHDDLLDNAVLQWLFKPFALTVITKKWYSYLGFNIIIWFLAWNFWLLSIGFSNYFWIIATCTCTLPIILGLSAFMAGLSNSYSKNTSLINLTILPLLAPLLIYGSGVFYDLHQGFDPSHVVSGLLAIAIIFISAMPRLLLAVLRMSISSEL